MQITLKDFDTIYNQVLFTHWCALNLPEKESEEFLKLIDLLEIQAEKERKRWKRQYAHIKEKRKENPNYARPKSEWRKN